MINKLIKSLITFGAIFIILNIFLIYCHFYPCLDNSVIIRVTGIILSLGLILSFLVFDISNNDKIF